MGYQRNFCIIVLPRADMLEAHDVFDATTEELLQELALVRRAWAATKAPAAARFFEQRQALIARELQERSSAEAICAELNQQGKPDGTLPHASASAANINGGGDKALQQALQPVVPRNNTTAGEPGTTLSATHPPIHPPTLSYTHPTSVTPCELDQSLDYVATAGMSPACTQQAAPTSGLISAPKNQTLATCVPKGCTEQPGRTAPQPSVVEQAAAVLHQPVNCSTALPDSTPQDSLATDIPEVNSPPDHASTVAPAAKPLSVLEAAMVAYAEEQKRLRQAKRALMKPAARPLKRVLQLPVAAHSHEQPQQAETRCGICKAGHKHSSVDTASTPSQPQAKRSSESVRSSHDSMRSSGGTLPQHSMLSTHSTAVPSTHLPTSMTPAPPHRNTYITQPQGLVGPLILSPAPTTSGLHVLPPDQARRSSEQEQEDHGAAQQACEVADEEVQEQPPGACSTSPEAHSVELEVLADVDPTPPAAHGSRRGSSDASSVQTEPGDGGERAAAAPGVAGVDPAGQGAWQAQSDSCDSSSASDSDHDPGSGPGSPRSKAAPQRDARSVPSRAVAAGEPMPVALWKDWDIMGQHDAVSAWGADTNDVDLFARVVRQPTLAPVPQALGAPSDSCRASVEQQDKSAKPFQEGWGTPRDAARAAALVPRAPAEERVPYHDIYKAFHDILSLCSPLNSPAPLDTTALVRQQRYYGVDHVDISEKYQAIVRRCTIWLGALAPGTRPSCDQAEDEASEPPAEAANARYYSIVDDPEHPEVREILTIAFTNLGGWREDPVDRLPPAMQDSKPLHTTQHSPQPSRPHSASSRTGTDGGYVKGGAGGKQAGPAGAAGGQQVAADVSAHWDVERGGVRCNLWNFQWAWSHRVAVPLNDLLVWQKVNHFSESRQLTRKDLLKQQLQRCQVMYSGKLSALFRAMPTTFILPKERAALEEGFYRAASGIEPSITQPEGLNLWIMKPAAMSRGRGISLVGSLRDIPSHVQPSDPLVVQRYISAPLLVGGHKFDLRLYVLVTSFQPLEAFLYREGFARFATLPYSTDPADFSNTFIHLTNSSVQKERLGRAALPAFLQPTAEHPEGGSKVSLGRLWGLLATQGVKREVIWGRIVEVVVAALFAAQDAIPQQVNAFELFGFDVMIDAAQKLWLIEVNSSPSLSLDKPLDRQIKPQLIQDVIGLLDPVPFDRAELRDVLRRRTAPKSRSESRAAGVVPRSAGEQRQELQEDLDAVLDGGRPRPYGTPPRSLGNFECIAPSALLDKLLKLRAK